jgi:hypothetical protein
VVVPEAAAAVVSQVLTVAAVAAVPVELALTLEQT